MDVFDVFSRSGAAPERAAERSLSLPRTELRLVEIAFQKLGGRPARDLNEVATGISGDGLRCSAVLRQPVGGGGRVNSRALQPVILPKNKTTHRTTGFCFLLFNILQHPHTQPLTHNYVADSHRQSAQHSSFFLFMFKAELTSCPLSCHSYIRAVGSTAQISKVQESEQNISSFSNGK